MLIYKIFCEVFALFSDILAYLSYVSQQLAFFAAKLYNLVMFKYLRITSCIIAVLFAAAAIFVFVYAGMAWGFICVAAAALFFALTVLFKRLQEKKDLKDNPPPPEGDFITGRVKSDDGDADADTDADRDIDGE